MSHEIFLDNNATTQPLPEVTEAVMAAMSEFFGNASSANRTGERARRLLQVSRESVGELIGAGPESISFTSGATESNNWVLQRICKQPGNHFVTTATEHSSIKRLCDFGGPEQSRTSVRCPMKIVLTAIEPASLG